MFYEFTVKDTTYNLRLSMKDIIYLEKLIGINPMTIFGLDPANPVVPTITQMVAVFHAAARNYNHGISFDDACEIFNDWLKEGNSPGDFLSVITELFTECGIFSAKKESVKEEDEAEKN